jgi:hypothetical protein
VCAMLRKLVRAAPFWIVEFAVFFGLYLLFASKHTQLRPRRCASCLQA